MFYWLCDNTFFSHTGLQVQIILLVINVLVTEFSANVCKKNSNVNHLLVFMKLKNGSASNYTGFLANHIKPDKLHLNKKTEPRAVSIAR